MKFTKNVDLMRYLMIAEKQQRLLLKTAKTRPAREIHNTEASEHITTSSTSKSGGTNDKSYVPTAPKRMPRGNWRHNPSNRCKEEAMRGPFWALALPNRITHLADGSMLLHQQTLARKLLKMFNMDNANALSASMIGRSKTDNVPYCLAESEEEEFDKLKYLAVVGALLYLATNTQPDISFAVKVLVRHSQRPTARH
ncbi:hypothetical protein AXG93_684s1070 [Marchantia polymorpha subsp. ruderalis]|uniref:Reverse transcriptase Ty1/copia-type domain-containing protein n=1 Tax=Marchantia polymorpha subsp. ruderalis TaxID=1480154 RepID=A0A176W776_MARPO|nr:hypothetical protein AXG93_684s1070 [Marchantia polymorpha subsp. ruderalis]